MDRESIKSTLRVDSSDQIQIRSFFGKGFEKSIFDERFFEKRNGKQQTPYMYDILTETMLWAPY